MKKNTMMRVASALLVAVLLTTCAISGTFAKYVSESTVTATATVAKWEISVEGQNITTNSNAIAFDLAETWTDYDGSAEVHVGNKLLAPGTAGSFDFSIVNTSEVVAHYSIDLEEGLTNLPDNFVAANFPVEYSTNGENGWTKELNTLTVEGDLAIGGSAVVTIYWRWAFGTTDAEHAIDTALGVQAQTAAPTVTVTASITVEQVD